MATKIPEVTMSSIAHTGLSLRQMKDLEGIIKPLAKDGKRPPRQNLTNFWSRAKRAVEGLGPSIQMENLGNEAIHRLAPLLLGEHIYPIFANAVFMDWDDFMMEVENKFGLSKKQMLDAFYAMRPGNEETESEFLLRVEDFWLQHGESPKTCFRTFIPHLSLEYRRELKQLSRSRNAADLTWSQVIEDAGKCTQYSSLTPEDATY